MSKAIMPLEDYANTCDTIREKTGSAELIKSGEMPEKINEVYEAGQKSEYDITWDTIQNHGNPAIYNARFQSFTTDKDMWDKFYRPKYDFVHGNKSSPTSAFRLSVMTDVIKDNYCEGCNLSYTFYECTALENARTIYVNEDTNYTNAFNLCWELKEIRISGLIGQDGFNVRWSSKLSKDSHISIIDALSQTTSGLTVTFSKVAIQNAFGISDITNESTWTEEYRTLRNSRSNWTFAYS